MDRSFVGGIAGAIALGPRRADAQQTARVHRVGFMLLTCTPRCNCWLRK